jgi:hypothetical protein
VSLGAAAGQVVSWSDPEVVATVGAGARTGLTWIQEGGVTSNKVCFAVRGSLTLSPCVVTMTVGETRTIQALDAARQPVTGLTWTSSDATKVSLSTDDPPV